MVEKLKTILIIVLAIGFTLLLLDNLGFIKTRKEIRVYEPDELPMPAEQDEVNAPVPQINYYGALKSGE